MSEIFKIGDRVHPVAKPKGWGDCHIVSIDRADSLPMVVSCQNTPHMRFAADELELIDEKATTDDAAVSTGVPGPSAVDGGGTGTTPEPATEEIWEDPFGVDPLSGDVVGATDPTILELLKRNQTLEAINHQLMATIEAAVMTPSDGEFRYLEGTPRTTKRVHTKIVKNTKGYQHELSAEVTSDDPTEDVNGLVSELLGGADLLARRHIITAEYRDEHGLPLDTDLSR